jgi:DNA (cytosine-5)-methyltransferase 1
VGKLRLLDLFCGAGGAARGYDYAGFDITGIDNRRQPNYPYKFYKFNALEVASEFIQSFDVIHASPPCQLHSQSELRQSIPPVYTLDVGLQIKRAIEASNV